jgi:ribonuclease HI
MKKWCTYILTLRMAVKCIPLRIFTDGCCLNNQSKDKSKVRASYAYYCPDNAIGLKSKAIYIGCNSTNNRAELLAIVDAIESLYSIVQCECPQDTIIKCELVMDSEYCYNIINMWGAKWIRESSIDKKNYDIVKRLLESKQLLLSLGFVTLDFTLVNSHRKCPTNKDTDEYNLWYGNMIADTMTKEVLPVLSN